MLRKQVTIKPGNHFKSKADLLLEEMEQHVPIFSIEENEEEEESPVKINEEQKIRNTKLEMMPRMHRRQSYHAMALNKWNANLLAEELDRMPRPGQ